MASTDEELSRALERKVAIGDHIAKISNSEEVQNNQFNSSPLSKAMENTVSDFMIRFERRDGRSFSLPLVSGALLTLWLQALTDVHSAKPSLILREASPGLSSPGPECLVQHQPKDINNRESGDNDSEPIQPNLHSATKRDKHQNDLPLLLNSESNSQPKTLVEIATRLYVLYEESREIGYLSTAIECLEKAIGELDEHMSVGTVWMEDLVAWYCNRHKRLGNQNDFDRAEYWARRATSWSSETHIAIPYALQNSGRRHCDLFQTLGKPEEIDKATELLLYALAVAPPGYPGTPSLLDSLGLIYQLRFEKFRRYEDLSKSTGCLTLVVALTPDGHPDKPVRLNNLGLVHRQLFQTSGKPEDIRKAAECLTLSVELTPNNHPDKPTRLSNLGITHRSLFQRFGEEDDIRKAADCLGRAVELTPDSHPDKPDLLNSLGITHQSLFEAFGRHEDINKATECLRLAVELTPNDHPKQSIWLNGLGNIHRLLFHAFGRQEDLKQAADYLSRSVELTPDDNPDRVVRLNNLGITYQVLFHTFGKHEDISKAAEYLRLVVDLTPHGHPSEPARLSNLGHTYRSLFNLFGRQEDIEKAADCLTRAVSLAPDDHPEKPRFLNSLGVMHRSLFEVSQRGEDIDKALKYLRLSVELLPDAHSAQSTWLVYLGETYGLKPGYTSSNINPDAIRCYRDASLALTGKPSIKLKASRMWASLTKLSLGPSLEPFVHCMQLLPEVVWIGGSVHDRYMCLAADAKGIVIEAAATAIEIQEYKTALKWLEQGRCMVWNQLLELRSPLDLLSDVHPDMAKELQRVSDQLEHSPMSSSDEATSAVAHQHRQWAVRRDQLIESIRQQDGFEDFLRPPKASQLLSNHRADVVVTLNIAPGRCDALMMRSGSLIVDHVALPNFSYQQADQARRELADRVVGRGSDRTFTQRRARPKMPIEQVLGLLWAGIVRPILAHLNITHVASIDELPHIVWCITGPLSSLPIHAAGDYSTGRADTVLYNLAISSYTPNLTVLGRASSPATSFSGLLAVGMGLPVRGLKSLPGIEHELSSVRKAFDSGIQYTELTGRDACQESVLQSVAKHSWIHLACHASQDGKNPLQSAFHLHDADLDLSAIIRTRLANADFAFLSACQTATGDTELPDEAVHLAAGLLVAGFRTVIASMWAINDQDAPLVAEKVYEYMLEGGAPDSRRAAKALHKAMMYLRDTIGVDQYMRWVPYVHMGC